MYRGNNNRIFPVIIIIIVVALIITAIVSAVQSLMNRGNNDATEAQVATIQDKLFDTSGSNRVRMTVRGPIVADEKHHSYRVVVSPSSRSLVTYNGYLDSPIDSLQFNNNARAYDEFVHALDKANIFEGKPLTGDADDTRGICATGRVYEYELLQGNSVAIRLWTSTCKGSVGSLRASNQQLHNLFITQIPDNEEALKKIDAI